MNITRGVDPPPAAQVAPNARAPRRSRRRPPWGLPLLPPVTMRRVFIRGRVLMFRGASYLRPAGRAFITFESCFLLLGAACSVLKSPSARVRRAASRSPRRAPPPRAPFGAPAGRGGASPSPWGGGALYPVGVLAGCAPLLLPSPSRFALLPSVCPRRVGRAVCFRAALRAALRTRFSFPRGVRRCGAPPSSGRRHAPPPSCAFSLPSARVSLPPFLPRVLSPFRECS